MHIDKEWWIRIAVAPILVGLIVQVFIHSPSLISEKKVELSYSIDEPVISFDKNAMGNGNVDIRIGNTSTDLLIGQPVHIWNSGGIPIEKLCMTYLFKNVDKNFRVFDVTYSTKPPYEFGSISLLEKSNNSRRYSYELLNPNDEFTAIFWINKNAPIEVYAKHPGLNFKQITISAEKNIVLNPAFFSWVGAFLGAIITSIMAAVMARRIAREKKKRERSEYCKTAPEYIH